MPHDGDDDDRFRAPSDNVVDFPNAEEVIEKLADLPEIEYDQHRNAEAKRLGVRREILDRAVKAKRGDGEEAPFVLPESGEDIDRTIRTTSAHHRARPFSRSS